MAKITKAEMPALAEQIVKCLGGKENVARINHCATTSFRQRTAPHACA